MQFLLGFLWSAIASASAEILVFGLLFIVIYAECDALANTALVQRHPQWELRILTIMVASLIAVFLPLCIYAFDAALTQGMAASYKPGPYHMPSCFAGHCVPPTPDLILGTLCGLPLSFAFAMGCLYVAGFVQFVGGGLSRLVPHRRGTAPGRGTTLPRAQRRAAHRPKSGEWPDIPSPGPSDF